MEQLLQEVQQTMLHYDIAGASQHLVELFDALLQVEHQLPDSHQEKFQAILQQLNLAMQNQDYLLTADLLEYEIRPLISRIYQ